jgi:lysozyme family protein
MADFKKAWDITGKNEGGLVNYPADHGGYTYCGITQKNFPDWLGWQIVTKYPFHEGAVYPELVPLVMQFYKENFWDKVGGDGIADQDLANQVFDFAVNAGVGEALKLLKQS